MHRTVGSLKQALNTPVYALPVDALRILVGLLGFFYFLRTWLEVKDFSSPDGLIDHALLQELFWMTRLSLFQSGMGEPVFRFAYLLAMLASLLLALGIRVTLSAIVLYAIAVSTYRWNVLVSYVEDGVMHLLFFWMILLPVGATLTLPEAIHRGRSALARWKDQTVPGATVRLFLGNLAMVYVVAGLWKWTSPMWRQGTALYVILKLPVSRWPDFWGPEHLPVLKVITFVTLITEPLLALLVLGLTRRVLKGVLVAILLGFHLGIVATMDLPLANLGMAGALVLVFRQELMQFVHGHVNVTAPRISPLYGFGERLAVFVVACLAFQMIADVQNPRWRAPAVEAGGGREEFAKERVVADVLSANPFHAPLWMVGIAQSYRLFDWIDDRNFVFHYAVVERRHGRDEAVDLAQLFPSSPRSVLLQANLHGVTWAKIPASRQGELKRSIYLRAARRYCRRQGPGGRVQVYATVERVALYRGGSAPPLPRRLLQFECRPAGPDISYMRI